MAIDGGISHTKRAIIKKRRADGMRAEAKALKKREQEKKKAAAKKKASASGTSRKA